MCVCEGVNSDNCTERVFVPRSHAAGTESEERKQGHVSLPYLFISPSPSHQHWSLYGPELTDASLLPFSILFVFPDGSVKTNRRMERTLNGTALCEGDETTHKKQVGKVITESPRDAIL